MLFLLHAHGLHHCCCCTTVTAHHLRARNSISRQVQRRINWMRGACRSTRPARRSGRPCSSQQTCASTATPAGAALRAFVDEVMDLVELHPNRNSLVRLSSGALGASRRAENAQHALAPMTAGTAAHLAGAAQHARPACCAPAAAAHGTMCHTGGLQSRASA